MGFTRGSLAGPASISRIESEGRSAERREARTTPVFSCWYEELRLDMVSDEKGRGSWSTCYTASCDYVVEFRGLVRHGDWSSII